MIHKRKMQNHDTNLEPPRNKSNKTNRGKKCNIKKLKLLNYIQNMFL